MTQLLSIILAAGEGTRMKSAMPKVLHEVGGLPLVSHVVRSAQLAGATAISVVVGPGHEAVRSEVSRVAPHATFADQLERLGTGHAVRMARAAFDDLDGNVLVLLADAPLVNAQTIAAVADRLKIGVDVVVVGFEAENPTGYGRLILEGSGLVAIREEKEATEAQRAVKLCNSGIIGFRADALRSVIDRIENKNAKGEFYLTDAIELAIADGRRAEVISADEGEVQGVNDRSQLAKAERQFQDLRREDFMKAGVTLKDPGSVWFSYDTEIARDVTIEPNVYFGPGVTIGEGAVIHAFCHIEGASIGPRASVGPFARLRPEAKLGEGAKVGNFVEIKKADIGRGAKVSHLTYIGDATIGEEVNIGAGVITVNYDG